MAASRKVNIDNVQEAGGKVLTPQVENLSLLVGTTPDTSPSSSIGVPENKLADNDNEDQTKSKNSQNLHQRVQQKIDDSDYIPRNKYISNDSDSISSSSTISSYSHTSFDAIMGVHLNESMNSGYPEKEFDSDDEDSMDQSIQSDITQRTPIPKVPPPLAGLPGTPFGPQIPTTSDSSKKPSGGISNMFPKILKTGHISQDPDRVIIPSDKSIVSDISSDDEASIGRRTKRESRNLGRLVTAAKQQQSFAQLWFAASQGANTNALPALKPKKSKTAKKTDSKKKTSINVSLTDSSSTSSSSNSAGPIDLDSGESWSDDEAGNDIEHDAKSVPIDDKEEISTGNWWDKIFCTIRHKIYSYRLVAITLCFASIFVGCVIGVSLNAVGKDKQINSSKVLPPISIPLPSNSPTIRAFRGTTATPSKIPSNSPSINLSNAPQSTPSNFPSLITSHVPSSSPLPSLYPSRTPSMTRSLLPSQDPTTQPTVIRSAYPSDAPSLMPSSFANSKFSVYSPYIIGQKNDMAKLSLALSRDGNIMAVGTRTTPGNTYVGFVTIYKLVQKNEYSKEWKIMGQVLDGDNHIDEGYRNSISMSDDGQIVAISMPNKGVVSGNDDEGLVKVYQYNSTALDSSLHRWVQLGRTIEGECWVYQKLGYSLSLSGDGKRLVIGSPDYDTNGNGKFTIYQYINNADNTADWESIWHEEGKSPNNHFGKRVSISGDGNVVVISGKEGVSGKINDKVGYVKVFRRNKKHQSWIGKKIVGDREYFGYSLSVSDHGNRIAISSPVSAVESTHDDDLLCRSTSDCLSSGTVFVYQFLESSSEWEILGRNITGSPSTDVSLQSVDVSFGLSISMSQDGNYVAIGSPDNPTSNPRPNSGKASVYRWNGLTWVSSESLYGTNEVNESFGYKVVLAGNGKLLAVGATGYGQSLNGFVRLYQSENNEAK